MRAIRERVVDPALLALDIGADVVFATREAVERLPRAGAPSRREVAFLCWALLRTDENGSPLYPGGIGYIAETNDQHVRLPWRTLADARADCKSQTVLIASVCAVAGCEVFIRMVRLPENEHFGHVYTLVDGVAVDPLLEFGEECVYLDASTIRIHGKEDHS